MAMRIKYLLQAHGAWGVIDRERSSKEVDESMQELALTNMSQSTVDAPLPPVGEETGL